MVLYGGLMVRGNQQRFVEGRVSIVTPVYNGERHLAFMLDSVLKQTYPHVEMILVDDGSTDRTVQIAESYCERFADRGYGFHMIRTDHKNAAAAINCGLPYVTGEYLTWPDSDDILEPESIEKRAAFLEENPQYRCVRTLPYYFIQETGTHTKADENIGDLSKEDLFWDILECKTFVCCGCYMLRADCFFEIYRERHIPEYDLGQNFQMLLPFMYYHRCPTIHEALYGVCVRKGSHSRAKLTLEEEEQRTRDYEKLVDVIAEICHIEDRESRKRIAYWKISRRFAIASKYKKLKYKNRYAKA